MNIFHEITQHFGQQQIWFVHSCGDKVRKHRAVKCLCTKHYYHRNNVAIKNTIKEPSYDMKRRIPSNTHVFFSFDDNVEYL